MTGARRTSAICRVTWGDNRCELPAGHSGPHRRTVNDEHGQQRVRTWLSRWAA